MSSPRAVLFDVGGTLFPYAMGGPEMAVVFGDFMRLLGIDGEPDQKVIEARRDGARRSAREFAERRFYFHREMLATGWLYAAENLGRSLPYNHAEQLAVKTFHAIISPPLRPGLVETLGQLRLRGLHLGAVSNADEDQLEVMLAKEDVGRLFHSALCSETVRSCKPDPAIFREALRRAGCEPQDAVFVGDTPDHDIAGAAALGMRTVLIADNGGMQVGQTEQPGDHVIHEVAELLEILS